MYKFLRGFLIEYVSIYLINDTGYVKTSYF